MGLASLDALPQSVAVNARNFEAYRRGLDDVMGLSMLAPAEHRQYVVLQIDEQAVLSRDEMQRVLWAENVLARRYFFPGCHRMEPYCSQFQGLSLPVTERLAERVLVLPTGPALDESDVERVVDIIRRAVARGPDLARALRNAVA
jgi:dTDP-4-amino-4,6-dideoxygalactose transaminase